MDSNKYYFKGWEVGFNNKVLQLYVKTSAEDYPYRV